MIFDKNKLSFTGKEYLEYIKYKDSKPKIKLKLGHWIIISSISVAILLIGLIISFQTPVKTQYTWNGILMFLTVSGGIGWILHGTGFLLVRR